VAEKSWYQQQLSHPKWQKKRLEVLSRDGFTCCNCGSEDTTLQVHHTYYERGLRPWEYPLESYWTLCEPCHKRVQERMTQLNRAIGAIGIAEMDVLLGCALALGSRPVQQPVAIDSYEVAEGFAQMLGRTPDDIVGRLNNGHLSTLDLRREVAS
jgi:hypothetical protein